jgi:hypothetical protein
MCIHSLRAIPPFLRASFQVAITKTKNGIKELSDFENILNL